MKLYWGSGSPVSWRAQLALALKRIRYDSHRLDLGQREHRGEAFRAINPRGTFPVLVDGEVTVRDSLAILAYLERRHPDPPLFGATPAEAAEIWQWVAEHDAGAGAGADAVTRALFRDGGLDDPDPARKALEALHAALGELEERLATATWMAGGTPSAVEVLYYPTVHRLLRATSKPGAESLGLTPDWLAEQHPAVDRWMERIAALPGVEETYPPHWREVPESS